MTIGGFYLKYLNIFYEEGMGIKIRQLSADCHNHIVVEELAFLLSSFGRDEDILNYFIAFI